MFWLVKLFVYLKPRYPVVGSLSDSHLACLLMLVAAFLFLTVGAGWFCTMMEPSFSGIDGERTRRGLIRYVATFVALQIGIAPLMFEIASAATSSLFP